jgi:hypothetical protein
MSDPLPGAPSPGAEPEIPDALLSLVELQDRYPDGIATTVFPWPQGYRLKKLPSAEEPAD